MSIAKKPHIIELPKLGRPEIGYISVSEAGDIIPFPVKRVFWTYYTPESIVRGRHAHYETEMVLIAAAGRVILNTEMVPGEIETWVLDKPNVGVYMPPKCWHTMQYSHSSIQLVLASSVYNESDYIRSYDDFCDLFK